MSKETPIPGGYILLSRKIIESEIMHKPPHYLKLWLWMLAKAFWTDGETLKRGQLHTTIGEMQDVGRYLNGGKLVNRLTENQVRSVYGYLMETKAISVTKTTRGLVISIINFDTYQDAASYQPHTNNGTRTDHTTDHATNHTQNMPLLTENTIKNYHRRVNGPRNGTKNGFRTDHTGIDEEVKRIKISCATPSTRRLPTGDHHTFIAWWKFAFELTQGKPYLFAGKDFKLVKELLQTYQLKPLVVMACWFLTCNDTWLGSKRDLTMLKSQINRIPGSKDDGHDANAYRAAGIIPPVGMKFEDWHFWEHAETQEVTAL